MELRTIDPRKLKPSPDNPRRCAAGDYLDAQMLASIKAIGLVQPPLVQAQGKKLVIIAGHRRVAACVAAELPTIPVLVMDDADAALGPMRSISENLIRADMGQVDRWRAMQALAAAGWNDAAIAEALGMTPRNIAQARLLANICPAMLDQMSRNDLPTPQQLRVISAAPKEEQAEVWKAHKPKRGHEAEWHIVARALTRARMMARDAKFGPEEAARFGIVFVEDLFAPADEDSRATTQVDAFLAAQEAWLEQNLPAGACIVPTDAYGEPMLPKGARPHWGREGEGVLTACYVEARNGSIRQQLYTLAAAPHANTAPDDVPATPVRKPRPDVTQKGAAMVGDLRTDALHQALRERSIGDDQLMGMLVLALGGRNVTVKSGVAGRGYGGNKLAKLAETLTEGGVLSHDLATLRQAAREALVEVLSCREDHSASGMGARHAGAAIDADAFLPSMATEDFLPVLSRAALEQCAAEHAIAIQSRVKDTRAAVLAHFREATFIYPGARFAPTADELAARRNPASMFGGGEGDDEDGSGEGHSAEPGGGHGAERDEEPDAGEDAPAPNVAIPSAASAAVPASMAA